MRLLIAVAAALVLSTAAHASPAQDLAEGRNQFRAGKYREASKHLAGLFYPETRLASPDEQLEAHTLLGVCYFETGDRKSATREFEEALFLDPQHKLDPQLFSSGAIDYFEEVKKQKELRDKAAADARKRAEELERLRKYRESLRFVEKRSFIVNFLPLGSGQFQNGHRRKGFLFAGGQAVSAGVTVGIFAYLVNEYGYGGSVPEEEAGTVRTLQQIAIAGDVVFYGLYLWSVVDAIYYYKPQAQIEGDDSLLPPELRETPEPKQRTKPKPKSQSKLRLLPFHVPDGAGMALSWEH